MAYSNKETQIKFQRQWKRKLHRANRIEAIEMFGGKCMGENCVVTDIRVLHFDHIKAVLRPEKSRKDSGTELVRKILSGKVDKNTIQLLCANCHQIKTYEDRYLFDNKLRSDAIEDAKQRSFPLSA